jgi:hypothetical protein
MRVVVLRSGFAGGGAAARRTCVPGVLASLDRTGDSAFVARQRFKMLADCTKVDTAANQRQHAAKAFDLVDRVRVTLIGGSDIARFERVMQSLLAPFGISFQAAHLDPGPSPGGPAIQISMPGETVPLWYAASLDDVIAARIVSAMGSAVRPFPLSVAAGVVSIPPNAGVSRALLTRLETIPGVKAVQVRALAY